MKRKFYESPWMEEVKFAKEDIVTASIDNSKFKDDEVGDFHLPIKWNIKEIAGREKSNGFIVQHMNIASSISCIPSANYFEAWLVTEGKISMEDKMPHWDDKWSVYYSDIDINTSIKTITVTHSSKVYRIPSISDEFKKVILWKRNTVFEAGNLRSTYSIDWDISSFYVGDREYISCRCYENLFDNSG